MPLHQSLLDLAELAPRCSSPATARGLLTEAQDLTRNALEHRENEVTLAAWYSRIITDILRSPGVSNELGAVRATGSVALGDATPATPITWLATQDDNSALVELFASVGLAAGSVPDATASRVDAGLPVGIDGEAALLDEALTQRPPALQLVNSLPDPEQAVDISAHLLRPIQALARWVAPAPRPTPDRLAIGRERELLSDSDAHTLTLAWGTGMALRMKTWMDHVDGSDLLFGELPPLDRTGYGSACRMVAEVFDSLSARER